jgi:hypothetical protein
LVIADVKNQALFLRPDVFIAFDLVIKAIHRHTDVLLPHKPGRYLSAILCVVIEAKRAFGNKVDVPANLTFFEKVLSFSKVFVLEDFDDIFLKARGHGKN